MTMPTDELAAALARFTSGQDYPQDSDFFEEHNCTRYEADCELLAKAFVTHRQQVAALAAKWLASASAAQAAIAHDPHMHPSAQATALTLVECANELESLGAKP